MDKKIVFRRFEERDVDFIYKAKNNPRINLYTIGSFHPITMESALEWVHGCMKDSSDYKFWAISTNDEENKIIGWCGLCDISNANKSACIKGITIDNATYRNGVAWFEAYCFLMDYVFRTLNFNRLYSVSLLSNKHASTINNLFFNSTEGILKQAICKDGAFYDIVINAILKEEYEILYKNGMIDSSVFVEKLKEYTHNRIKEKCDFESFADLFDDLLETSNISGKEFDFKFRELDEWSSLFAFDTMCAIEEFFQIHLELEDFDECETIGDLYEMGQRLSEKNIDNNKVLNFESNVNFGDFVSLFKS